MLVSVIIPVFNRERFLAEAIESVLAQDHTDLELIVVDDFSTDGSLAVAQGFKDPRIVVLKNDSKGKVPAFNRGIAAAKGDFLHLFASDDLLEPTCLSECLAAARDCDAVYHDLLVVDENGRPQQVMKVGGELEAASFDEVVGRRLGVASGVWLFSRRLSDATWPLGPDIPYEDLWLTVRYKLEGRVKYLPRSLYKYRQHGDQTYGRLDDLSYERMVFRAGRELKVLEKIARDSAIAARLGAEARRLLERRIRYCRAVVEKPALTKLFRQELDLKDKLFITAKRVIPESVYVAFRKLAMTRR